MLACTQAEKEKIEQTFPMLMEQILHYEKDFLPRKIAISIFNRWLMEDYVKATKFTYLRRAL